MNRKNDLLKLGEVYDQALLTEAKDKLPKGTFKVVTDKKPKDAKASPKAFVHKDSGPIKAAQTAPSINEPIDPAKMTKKRLETNLYEPGKFSQKNESSNINIHMSKKFDDLFNDVMTDKLHLENKDIEAVEDVAELPELGEGEGEFGDEGIEAGEGEGEDLEVDELIAKAIDYLSQAQEKLSGGGEEIESGEGEGELGAEGEDKGAFAAEETELEEVKDSAGQGLTKQGDQKVKTSWKASGGKAQNVSAYKTTLDDGEAKESDLHNPKKKPADIAGSSVKAGRQIGQ